jgi:thiol-disulfide isomerase/thioredoxin
MGDYAHLSYPVIYYFNSPYCAPCHQVEKMLDEINISLFGNRLVVRKINIVNEVDIAQKYNVLSVPTIIIGASRLTVFIDKTELTDAILQGFLSSVSLDESFEKEKGSASDTEPISEP